MSTQVTQCPNCHTSFRVTQAQLEIANGKVRCGSCLHIFQASDHWTSSAADKSAPPEKTQTTSPEPALETASNSASSEITASASASPTQEITESFTVDFEDAEILQGDFTIKDGFTIDADTREMQAIDTETLEAATGASSTENNTAPAEKAIDALDTLESIKQDLDDNLENLFNHDTDSEVDDGSMEAAPANDATEEFVFEDTAQQPIIETFDEEASILLEEDDDGDFFINEDDDPSLELEEQTSEAIIPPTEEQITEAATEQNAEESFAELDDDDDLLFSDDQGLDDIDAELEDTRDTNKPLFEEGLISSEDFAPATDDTDFSENFLNLDELDEPEGVFDEIDREDTNDTESWAQQLLEDETDEVAAVADSPATEESTKPSNAPDSNKELDDLTAILDEPIEGDLNTDDFPDLLDDSASDTQDIDPELLNILGEPNPSPSKQPYKEDEFVLGDEPMVAGERITDNKDDLLAGIEPEPVMFNKAASRGNLAKKLYTAASIAAIILLGLQFVMVNFDNLARDERYRGLFSSICGLAPCTLPSRQDLASISSSNLIVRSHPSVGNALVVDTIITNRASFTQPYPALELQFTNLNGEVVAQRRFKPSEYLSGELSGSQSMPSRQPIHIAIEILDPGQQAMNYQLRIVAQDS